MTDEHAESEPVDSGLPEPAHGPVIAGTRMPQWVIPATIIFWTGALVAVAVRYMWSQLGGTMVLLIISLFLSLAIEPGVNRLAKHGAGGAATRRRLMLFGVALLFLLFLVAIGTLVGSQIADLLQNTESYIRDTVGTSTTRSAPTSIRKRRSTTFNDPDGSVQRFISDQQGNAVHLSVAALGVLLKLFSVMLFTFYLIADGPRCGACDLQPPAPGAPGAGCSSIWELAANKTGGYLYSRALLALLSAIFHWIVFQSVGTGAPVALALWVGIVSQFLPVVGTYLAGVLPVLVTFLDSPLKALIVLDRHRRVPADRELPALAAHHRAHDGAAPGAGVRVGPRRRGRAGRGRRHPRPAGGGDGPSAAGRARFATRGDRQRSHPPARAAGALAGAPSRSREAVAQAFAHSNACAE